MKSHFAVATSLLAIVASGSPALAQNSAPQPAAENDSVMGDIVVTARRVEEKLQNVPIAVTVVTGAQLARLGVTGPVELRTVAAGLNVSNAGGRTSTAIYSIRGQRAGDQVFTQDPPVAVYLDDVLVSPLAGSNTGLFDIENVQVLKGPQGTLFGRNTTGGAVLFISAKPKAMFDAKVYGGIANYGSWNAGGYITGPLTDSLRLRAAIDYKDSRGYGTVLAGPQAGHRTNGAKQIAGRVSVAFEPTTNFSNLSTVSYSHYKDDGGPAFHILDTPRAGGGADAVFNYKYTPAPVYTGILADAIAAQRAAGPYDIRSGTLNGARVNIWMVANTTTFKLASNLTLKNVFGYRHLDSWDASDYDGTLLPILQSTAGARASTFSEELQLQGTGLNDRLNFIFGGYYFDQRGMEGSGTPFMNVANQLPGTVAFGAAPTMQFVRITNLSFSAFGQVGYKVTDSITVNAGIRYSVDTRRSAASSGKVSATVFNNGNPVPTVCNYTDRTGAPLPATYADCQIKGSTSFAEPSWLLGIDWKVDPSTLIYVSSRHSYRSGGFQSRPFDNTTAETPFNPEKVTDIELGLKRDWNLGGDTIFRTNLAAYYQWYSDIQRNSNTLTPSGVGNITRNAAKAHIYGFELETELRFGRMASLSFNYAYVKPKYDSFPSAYYDPSTKAFIPQDRSNYAWANIPTSQINGALTLTPEVGTLGKLALTANLYYQSRAYFGEDYFDPASLRAVIPTNSPALPADVFYSQKGYALVNLRAQLDKIMGTGFSASVWMKNVFDKRYVDSGVVFQNSIGFGTGIYGPPRTFGLDLSFQF